MKYLFGAVVILYGLLSIIAPSIQMIKAKRKEYFVMLVGGCCLIIGFILWICMLKAAWVIGLIGLAITALGAWINGGINGKRHLLHHIVRWLCSVALLCGFIFL